MTSVLFACVLAVSLAHPASAQAEVPVIGPVIEGIGEVGHAILHPVDAVVEGFVKVLQAIFGGIEAKLIAAVITGLLTIPNFDSGHVAQLEHTTVALSAGMLSAVLTLSIFRYYISGLSDHGSGGFEAIQSLVRVGGAVGFIILWPGLFNEIVQFPQLFNQALLNSGGVQHNVALLFDAALVAGGGAFALGTGVGLIFLIVIGFIAALVFIALLWMKVLLSVMLMFLYVSMPLAVVVWPLPELSWLAGAAMKALSVALIVPCVWAILFALSAAINTDILTWVPTHSVIDTLLVRPLAGITLMILCLTIPRFLMRTALIGPHGQAGGGRMWRAVTIGLLGARTVSGAARGVSAAAAEGHAGAQRMIGALPSAARPPAGAGEGSLAARMVFGRSGFPDPRHGSPGAAKGSSTASEGDAASKAPSGKQGAEEALGRTRASVGVPGIETPQFDWETANTAGKAMHSASRLSPPSAGAVAAAMAQFSPETQRGLADFNSANPLKLREFAAQHLHSESLSAQQRDALVTIGSARGEAVEVGMNQAIGALDAAPPPASASSSPAGAEREPGSPTGAPQSSSPPAAALTEQPSHTGPAASQPPPPPAAPTPPGGDAPPTAASGRGAGITPRQAPGTPVEQPRTPDGGGGGPASPPSRDLPDVEPFLD